MPIRPRIWIALACLSLALACAAPRESADLVLTNGRVYSFDWQEPGPDGTPSPSAPYADGTWSPDAEAVAMRDGRIVYVGSSEGAADWIGDATRVIDLAGATVLPGLVDAHTHVSGLGANLSRVDLTDAEDEAQAVERMALRAAETPTGEWIIGWGWDEGAWAGRYPSFELLSAKVPEHPAILQSLHGFAVWGNRLAFEKAGIGRDTPNPDGGEIVRGPDGAPTGILLNRATALLLDAVPVPTPEQIEEQILAGLGEMARSGYTAVHEAGLGSDLMAAYERLAAAGRLPIRVYAMLSARDAPLMRRWIERGPDRDPADRLWCRAVKAYYDGALGSRGARLLADYADLPGHRGVAGGEYGFDQALVADAMGAGFQVAIHAIGDAGNRETLDFLAGVFKDAPNTAAGRHRIEHAQILHPEDLPRFAELGVIASMQPPHAVEDKTWAEDRLGAERIHGAYAWRSLRRSGARLVFSSDLAGSDHDIFYGLHATITRRGKDLQPTAGWYAQEALSAEEAIRGYTTWAAYAAFAEDEVGVLAPGRWADLTVMDLDPLVTGSKDPAALLDGRILRTIVGGRIVYER